MNIPQLINPKGRGASIRELPTATKIAALLIGVIILSAVILVVRVGSAVSRSLLERDLSTQQESSRVEAMRLIMAINNEISNLSAFADSSAVQSALAGDEAAVADIQSVLEDFRSDSSQMMAAVLVDMDENIVAVTPAASDTTTSDRWVWFDALEEARRSDTFVSGEITDDGITLLKGVHIAVPVFNAQNQQQGVLYVVLEPAFFVPSGITENPALGIYDAEGNIIIASDRQANSIRSDVRDQMLSEPSGGTISTLGNSALAYGYTRISDLGITEVPGSTGEWIVSLQQDAEPLMADIRVVRGGMQLFILVGALILSLIIAGVVFSLARPLVELAITAEQIAGTDELNIAVPQNGNAYDVKMLSGGLQNLLGRLQYRARQLDAAAAVSRESVQHEVRALLDQVAHTIHDRLPYPEIYIYLMEPDGLRARVVAAYGTQGRNLLKPGSAVVLSEKQPVGRALLWKRTEWFDGVKSAFAGKSEEPAEVALPFAEATGALHIIGNGPQAFGKPDVDMLQLIANEIGAIVENRRLFEEAEAAKEEAEQANRIKSQFLANMSHELRTPLNAILNFTGFVADGDVGPVNQEQKDLLDKVYQSGEHLLNLINDILDLSKIEAGMLQFLMEDVELNRILDSTLSTSKGLVKQKQIELLSEIEEDLPMLVGDKRRLRQVFLNLMSNAIKFTNEGFVKLSAYSDNGTVHVMVQDTGAGIPPEDQHLVFETFRQAKHEFEVGGTGLGLSISKHFIEAHGGRIWFESVYHEGSTFHVTLPIKAAVDEMDTTAAAMN